MPFAKGNKHGGRSPGRPKTDADVRALARSYTTKAMDTLAFLMEHAENEETRARCAERLLNRGWGMPEETTTHDVPQAGTLADFLRTWMKTAPRTTGVIPGDRM